MNDELQVSFEELEAQEQALRREVRSTRVLLRLTRREFVCCGCGEGRLRRCVRGAQMSLDEDMRSTKSPSMTRFYAELKAGIADPPQHLLPLALGTLKVRDAGFTLA